MADARARPGGESRSAPTQPASGRQPAQPQQRPFPRGHVAQIDLRIDEPRRLALGIEQHVHIMGARADVPEFLLAADLLLHPSTHENTGTALLEALAAGLPVLTTAVCGYAHYINDADAGVVLPAEFNQQTWNAALEKMLLSPELKQHGVNGLQFAKSADIYSMPERAVDLIEQKVKQ